MTEHESSMWHATFEDGPLAAPLHDRSIVGPFRRRLVFARSSAHPTGFMLVGADDNSPIEGSPAVETYAYVTDDEPDLELEWHERPRCTYRLESEA